MTVAVSKNDIDRGAKGCMNTLDCINCLLQVEEKYHLPEDNIDGFSYWIYHREAFMAKMLENKDHYGASYQVNRLPAGTRLKLRLGMIKNALFHKSVPLINADLMIFNHERRVRNGERYDCIYTDEIAKCFPNVVVFERPYKQQHLRPVNTDNLVYTDRIEVLATVSLLFHKIILKNGYEHVRQQVRKRIKPACDEIAQSMQVDYDIEEIVTMISDGYFLYQRKKELFDAEIRKYEPKAILEVVGDNADCMVVNELAAARGIPTIELQHGVTGREHTAYNYPKGITVRQFPQYFFTFSQYWCTQGRYPIPENHCRAVGFPHLEQNAVKFRDIDKDAKKVILFISQKPVGKELSDIAVELEQKIDKNIYRIIYKLHPGEYDGWRTDYPDLAQSGIEVIDNYETELYYLFAISAYQIGGLSSTAIFEGLYFGLRTYIYREKAVSFLLSLCEQGYADAFDSAQDLYRMICESSSVSERAAVFWKENALQNMKREIEAVIGRNI